MWFPIEVIANQKLAKLKAQRYYKIFFYFITKHQKDVLCQHAHW